MTRLPSQKRTVDGTMYTFECLQGDGKFDEIEVYVSFLGSNLYPKFRYTKSLHSSWTLVGKSCRESAHVRDVLEEIWDGASREARS